MRSPAGYSDFMAECDDGEFVKFDDIKEFLKPTANTGSLKLPPVEGVLNHINEVSSKENCNVLSRQVGAELAYIYIRRQLQAGA